MVWMIQIALILLLILGFLLLFILIMLLLPVEYRSHGEKNSKGHLDASVRMVFGLLEVRYFLNDQLGRGEFKALAWTIPIQAGSDKNNKAEKVRKKKARKINKKKIVKEKKSMKPFLNREVFAEGRKGVARLIQRTRPNHFRIEGIIGLDDPAMTGQIFAWYYASYRFFQKVGIQLRPSFPDARLEGYYSVEGRIIPGELLLVCIRFVLSKPVRTAWLKRRKM